MNEPCRIATELARANVAEIAHPLAAFGSFHVLRHTHGSTLAMRGVPMGVIAEQLGHADTRMTAKNYAHLAPSNVTRTIRAHFPTLGIVGDATVTAMKPKKRTGHPTASDS